MAIPDRNYGNNNRPDTEISRLTRRLLYFTIGIVIIGGAALLLAILAGISQNQISQIIEQENKTLNFQQYFNITGEPIILDDGNYSDAHISPTLSVAAILPHHMRFIVQNATFNAGLSTCDRVPPTVTLERPIEYVMSSGANDYEFKIPLKFTYEPNKVSKPLDNQSGVELGYGDIFFNIDVIDAQVVNSPIQHYNATSELDIRKDSLEC